MQLLAHNTRRTKVLELSPGTHRIPEELKKHFLTDEHGAQYSTNLDRNRYGSDNNYLFTVIKHDLETLGLCPCLVDVEIIDAKAHGDSQLVNAAAEACICGGGAAAAAAPASMPPPQPQPQPQAQPQGECSQLFEALVAAAAGARLARVRCMCAGASVPQCSTAHAPLRTSAPACRRDGGAGGGGHGGAGWPRRAASRGR